MPQFRKKPVVIEARQFFPETGEEIAAWVNGGDAWNRGPASPIGEGAGDAFVYKGLIIQTLEGNMHVAPKDWVICGVKGEFYPCKPDIFDATYESAETGT